MSTIIKLSNNMGDLEFTKGSSGYYPFKIIFGRNGAGKSSLSDAFFNYKMKEKKENSFFYDKNVFNIENINEFENIIVFNRDFLPYIPEGMTEDSEVKIVFVENDELDNINEMINEVEKDISRIASSIARYGGSLKYPEKTLARRMNKIGINGVSFNRVKKERFYPNSIGFLEEIIDKMEALNKEELDMRQAIIVNDIEKALISNRFRNILELKDYVENKKNQLEEYKKDQYNLINSPKISQTEKNNYKEMNKYLRFIFFDENRLLINSMNNYSSRGKAVDNFLKLSTAEKNIIKLVYFFINLEESIKKNENVLIIIDDPISSVDYDNKIGIYSFLKIGIKKILEKTNNAKFIILTHDESVEKHLNKVLTDLINDIVNNKCKNIVQHYMIEDFKIKNSKRNHNYYSEQLQYIYKFISSKETTRVEEMTIGNVLRRVLEAYGTFNYRTGIIQLTKDKKILNKINNNRKELYENMLFRLLLNDLSHSEDVSKESNTGGVESERYSLKEKKKISKLVLCFLYELDNLHLEKHLQLESENIDKIFNDIMKLNNE